VLLCAFGALLSLTAQAATRFEIRSAFVEPANGVLQLHANLEFDLPEGARVALREGAPLSLDLEIVIRRARNWWLDETVATLGQRYEVVYHALSDRYLVRNVNSDEQNSFPTLDAALISLREVDRLPVIDQALLRPNTRHEVSLRASIDVHTMPDALRYIIFWADDWRQQSEWYTWPLKL
jgi:Domain of unknown function (DUF4390)